MTSSPTAVGVVPVPAGAKSSWPRVARELLFALSAALVYFAVRNLTASGADQALDNADAIIRLEKTLGIFREAAIQDALLGPHWTVTIANWVYIWGHWPVIALVAVWLARSKPHAYWQLREAFLISGGIGIVVFALFPVAPPRLAQLDILDTVTTYSRSYRVLQPHAFTNQFAAMPSLHFGWDLLIGIAIVRNSKILALRIVGVMLPVAMGLAVIVTANHYILDVVAGAATVLVALWITYWTGLEEVRRRFPHFYGGHGHHPAAAGSASSCSSLIVAHRAGNHLDQLEEAIRREARMVEVDVRYCNGRLEVRHSKTMGPVPLHWDRWSLEPAWGAPLVFSEVVKAAGSRTTLMIDLKGDSSDLTCGVIDVMRRYAADVPYVVSSQWWNALSPFEALPEATVLYSVGNEGMLAALEKRATSIDGVAIHKKLLSAERVRTLHAFAGVVASWPVNTTEELTILGGWGLDWAISDNWKELSA